MKTKVNEDRLKFRTQRVMLIVSVVLMGGKFLAYPLTCSAGILTDALESIANVAVGAIILHSRWHTAKASSRRPPLGNSIAAIIHAPPLAA